MNSHAETSTLPHIVRGPPSVRALGLSTTEDRTLEGSRHANTPCAVWTRQPPPHLDRHIADTDVHVLECVSEGNLSTGKVALSPDPEETRRLQMGVTQACGSMAGRGGPMSLLHRWCGDQWEQVYSAFRDLRERRLGHGRHQEVACQLHSALLSAVCTQRPEGRTQLGG